MQIDQSHNICIRSPNDFAYVWHADVGINDIRMFKANIAGSNPASFSEIDSGNRPSAPSGNYSACAGDIDSLGILHLACLFRDNIGGLDEIKYFTFHTEGASSNQDTWQIKNEKAGDIDRITYNQVTGGIDVKVDAGDIPHVAYIDERNIMGTVKQVVRHSRRTGGTWDSFSRVTPIGNDLSYQWFGFSIGEPTSAIGEDRPIIVAAGNDSNTLDVYHGDSIAGGGWEEERDITAPTDSQDSHFNEGRLIVDSNDDVVIHFCEETTFDGFIIRHIHANAWTNWETPELVQDTNRCFEQTMTVNDTNLYVIVNDGDGNGGRFFKEEGSGWSEETADADLPIVNLATRVKLRYSAFNQKNPREIDYAFFDTGGGNSLKWNSFQGADIVVGADNEPEYGVVIA